MESVCFVSSCYAHWQSEFSEIKLILICFWAEKQADFPKWVALKFFYYLITASHTRKVSSFKNVFNRVKCVSVSACVCGVGGGRVGGGREKLEWRTGNREWMKGESWGRWWRWYEGRRGGGTMGEKQEEERRGRQERRGEVRATPPRSKAKGHCSRF